MHPFNLELKRALYARVEQKSWVDSDVQDKSYSMCFNCPSVPVVCLHIFLIACCVESCFSIAINKQKVYRSITVFIRVIGGYLLATLIYFN